MIYRRGKAYWFNFRWTVRNADGTSESFRIRQSAKTRKRKDAEDAENEHRRALRLSEIHPNDPWPKPATSAPLVFRAFAKEFVQYAKTHTKPGTHTFYIHVTETHVAAGFGKFVEYQTRNVAEGLAAAFPQAREAVQ